MKRTYVVTTSGRVFCRVCSVILGAVASLNDQRGIAAHEDQNSDRHAKKGGKA